jgi:hypothetical protein
MENAYDDFEKHIFMWCIENYIPLKQFTPNEIHLVFYENLCVNPKNEIKKLFSYIGMEYKPKVLKTVKIPSAEARRDSAIITGEDLINKWKKDITQEQLKKTIDILSMFDLDSIYSTNSTPNPKSLYFTTELSSQYSLLDSFKSRKKYK